MPSGRLVPANHLVNTAVIDGNPVVADVAVREVYSLPTSPRVLNLLWVIFSSGTQYYSASLDGRGTCKSSGQCKNDAAVEPAECTVPASLYNVMKEVADRSSRNNLHS